MQLLADALDGNHLDLACIPVDPRLHSDCLRGLLAFDSRVFAKNILPIHFWGDFSVMQTLHDRLSPELFSRILTVSIRGRSAATCKSDGRYDTHIGLPFPILLVITIQKKKEE